MTENELLVYLDDLEKYLESINNESSHLTFQKYLDKKSNPRLIELDMLRSKTLLDPALHETVVNWVGKVSDPTLSRRLVVWQGHLLA
ncbi:MAG: hypothetical protein Q8N36_01940, partial [bacterium]|nr:hypothetical protein [bacterium]